MNINKSTKRVLVYGDSITYGRVPNLLDRFNIDIRWTGVLQKELGEDYEVIEEGLRARTLAGENPNFKHRNGLEQFGPIIGSHLPVDLIVIFLGTNDLCEAANKTPNQIAESLGDYIKHIDWWVSELRIKQAPEVLIIAPPYIDETVLKSDTIFRGAESKSKLLAALYEAQAKVHEAYFLDASQIVIASKDDGVHLDEENNRKLAVKLVDLIHTVLG